MQTTEMAVKRPFHEMVVDAIILASSSELEYLAKLIKATKIPKGHDKIITAWNQRTYEMGLGTDILGVPANLLEQKQAITKKADGENGINLDEFQQEIEKLLALLKDRQPGLTTWHEFVHERLQNLHKLTSQALGK